MPLKGKQKKYLLKYIKQKSVKQIASDLKVNEQEINLYLKERWGKEKYQQFVAKDNQRENVSLGNIKQIISNNWLILVYLSILSFVVYANSLGNGFVSDDRGITENLANKFIYKWGYVLYEPTVWLRPLLNYLVTHLIGPNPFGYRLINIFFHIGFVLVSYLFISLTLKNKKVSLISASILAVHPLQSESVAWISGGYYSQYSFFGLLSLLFYVLSKKKKFYLALSVVSFLLAIFTAEKAIVVPIIIGLYVICFDTLKERWKSLLPFVSISLVWVVIYLGKLGQRVSFLAVNHYQEPVKINPLYQIPVAITEYLKMMFWPSGLTLYHTELNFLSWHYYLRFIYFLFFLGFLVYSFFKNKTVFFWLSFFVISLLPFLTPFGISWLVAERYVYLGTLGIYTVLAIYLVKFFDKLPFKEAHFVFLAILVPILFTLTFIRNKDWKNEDTLWLAAAKTSPSSHQNHNNLGDMYMRHGDMAKAEEEFSKAIELKPNYADAYHNLALTYEKEQKYDLAITSYQNAIKYNPNLWQSHLNLANVYYKAGKLHLSAQELEQAVEMSPQNLILYLDLGIVYHDIGNIDKSKQNVEKALQLDPQNQKAQQLLDDLNKNN